MMILKTSRSNLSSNDQLALDLPFAATKSLTARVGPTPVFTRASTGTFVGSDGLIQSAAINTPRFDHTSAGVCRGLLIEESRTNAAFQSGAIVSNIGWVVSSGATGATSVASGTGPDSNTSYLISESATTAPHGLYNTGTNTFTLGASVTSGVAYTASAFVKKATGSIDWIQIILGTGGFGSQYANFNLTTGQFGNVSGLTTRVEEYANGWYRISVTRNATVTTSTTAAFGVNFINNTNGTTSGPSYAGSTSNQFLLTMCQFEAGSFATSYIPTTTASVVRSADVCDITSLSTWYNFTEGTMLAVFNGMMPDSLGGNRSIASISDGTYSNLISLAKTSTAANIQGEVTRTGTSQLSIVRAGYAQGGTQKIALALAANNSAFSFNGTINTDNTVVLPTTLSHLRFRDPTGASAGAPSGHYQSFRYFRKRLSNAKLQALTA
jgi:hypothetical protein